MPPTRSLPRRLLQEGGNARLWESSQARPHRRFQRTSRLPTPVVRIPYSQDFVSADLSPNGKATPIQLTGFGFTVMEQRRGQIRGEGFEYCSRLFMTDPTSGLCVDSHLPISDKEGLDYFRSYFGEVLSVLATLGFSLREATASLLYGVSDRTAGDILKRNHNAPGRQVAKIIAGYGVPLDAMIPVFDGGVAYDVSIMTGALEAIRYTSTDERAPNYRQLVRCLQTGAASATKMEILQELYGRIPRAQKPSVSADAFESEDLVDPAVDQFAASLHHLPIGNKIVHRAEVAQWLGWLDS